ncbi:MAG: imidazolonepropionase [Alphaproteobacteria bacterium]|nr:imidazolonepropionase [Alphaproteobacteria bacterium]
MTQPNVHLVMDCHAATMATGGAPYGTIRDAALVIEGERIAWIGPRGDLPKSWSERATRTDRLEGRWITPGLIDPHTHLIFGGTRVDEFEARNTGTSYAEIAAAGGGILSTVRATQAASEEDLSAGGADRLRALAADGVCVAEVKSGYGFNLNEELKMLRAAHHAGRLAGVEVVATYLGLHALPPEYRDDRSGYLSYVCDTALGAVAARGGADAVDAFCETIAFTPEETERYFRRAQQLGLKIKLHADQLSDTGGAALAAKYGALSADHLEYTSEAGIAALAAAGSVAVLLPGAYYYLRETKRPPVEALRAAGVPIALGSDLNPGTSPVASLLAILNMALILFGLTPEEALAGVTREAARALGRDDLGTLAPGKRADLAVWDIAHPAELTYWLGRQLCRGRFIAGTPVATPSIPGDFCHGLGAH